MRSLIPLLAFISLAGCDFDELLSFRAKFERTVPLDPTGTFRLTNTNGKVRVETWDRAEVHIEAEKAASSQDYLEEIQIEVDGQGNRVEVRARMPRGGFLRGGHGQVSYLVHVPAGARVEAKTVNGAVEVQGLAGSVQASTVNGAVRITDSSGPVGASTVNGSIRAEYRRAPPDGLSEFSTTNA